MIRTVLHATFLSAVLAACSGYEGGGDARIVPLGSSDAAASSDAASSPSGTDASTPRDGGVDSSVPEPKKSSIVAYYPFDNETTDRSKPSNGLDLVLQDGSYIAGKVGSSLIGTSGGLLASRPQVDSAFAFGSGDFTISAWILATPVPLTFGTRAQGGGDGWLVLMTQTNAQFTTPDSQGTLTANLSPVSAFRQLVLRRKDGRVELIVEASVLAVRETSNPIGPAQPFSIRRSTATAGAAPRIDELVIFSRALTDAELGEVRSAGQNGLPLSLDD